MTCTIVYCLPVCSSSLTNFFTDFAAAIPEDVTEDQVDKLNANLLQNQTLENTLFLNNHQDQEDFAASKLKSAVHAFLDKNGKVGYFCQPVHKIILLVLIICCYSKKGMMPIL